MKKTKAKEMVLKYRVDINWSEEDKCYIANIPELPNCMTHGDTMEEAVAMAKEAAQGYVETLKQEGLPIPVPLAEKRFSGKIALRIDPNLHRDIALKASMEGASLSKYIEERLRKSA
ncbi:MAG: type II toxin-antitoxin system HicB family antitoxin [Deltaproteobacteria bacterium]|nr:type II toxin-antitoxin system HicB family antitoxin [Deltaproteobacteria bacterium]